MKMVMLVMLLALSGCSMVYMGQSDEDYSTPTPDLSGLSVKGLADWVGYHTLIESDQQQFGVADYWQTPAETLANGAGDCEDFAILLIYLVHKYQGVDGTLVEETNGSGDYHIYPRIGGSDFWSLLGYRQVKTWTYGQGMWIAENTHGEGPYDKEVRLPK